jgi:hypothetical protein
MPQSSMRNAHHLPVVRAIRKPIALQPSERRFQFDQAVSLTNARAQL